jgi:NADH dehydrogenase FAD-containing subunit
MNNPNYQTTIVGGGFTGLLTALHLAHEQYPGEVVLIDRNDRFCFKPLLYEYFSGQMDAMQVVPRYEDLLQGSGVTFIQDSVQAIDLHGREVKLSSGTNYNYNNLVLALGSVTDYLGVTGAKENSLPFWTQADAIALDRHLRDCLQKACHTCDGEERCQLLNVAIIGAGPSGVEIAATLADLLPHWYEALGGNPREIRVILLSHGNEILQGDINSHVRSTAQIELSKRDVPVEFILGASATAIRPQEVEYKKGDCTMTLPVATAIWTTGSSIHPLIKELPITPEKRDRHGRLLVNPTLQLPDFPEVFAGGDCTFVKDSSLPATAQVAYQQGYAIAHNLTALASGEELKPAKVNLRGTLLKLGLENAAANIYDKFEINGKIGHLIRQATYLELLPTPIHNFKITAEWLKEEIFNRNIYPSPLGRTAQGAAIGALATQKLLKMLGDEVKKEAS